MRREEILEIQLRQVEQALATTRRAKEFAEQQYRHVLSLLHKIILSLLAPEWNELLREHDAAQWPPEQIASWIIDTIRAKVNRLEILASGYSPAEEDRQRKEVQQLQERIRQLETEIEQLRGQLERAKQWEEENQRLRAKIEALNQEFNPGPSGRAEIAGKTDPNLEISNISNGAIELLRIIGSTGLSLRDDIARAVGKSSRSGSTVDAFQELLNAGLIVEEPLPAEGKGKSPNVVRISSVGEQAYRLLTNLDPVEPEFERLLRRHKSPEQAMLALRARQVLYEFGAEVDLFPDAIPIGNGRVFQVDLTAVLEGHRIFVECERASTRSPRLDKWSMYRAVTTEFYFFVPNKTVLGQLMTELNLWAFRRIDEAQGVTVHIHQISAREKEDERKLWHYVRPLAGTAK